MGRATKCTMGRETKRMQEVDTIVTELCCGQLCDRDKRDTQLKLLGVQEFIRLYKKTVVLDDASKHCIDVVSSEYKMSLIPLK